MDRTLAFIIAIGLAILAPMFLAHFAPLAALVLVLAEAAAGTGWKLWAEHQL